jgi:tRNA dimethylallyltransferase
VGPTGVGKSEVAFLLAKKLGLEILSADAFQVYNGLPIGTAQPPLDWQSQVPHHLVGVRDPKLAWSAADFAREAKKILAECASKGKRVIVVGGAGFYLKALVDGLPAGGAAKPEVRLMVLERVRELGNEKAHEWLNEVDPSAAKRLHANDTQRICRALEKALDPATPKDFEPVGSSRVVFWGLERSREALDRLIQKRVEYMWNGGLLAEAEQLEKLNIPPAHPIWGTIGYAQALEFIRGNITEKEAIEKIFRRTRQYAKRQWTWFKRQHQVEWIQLDRNKDIGEVVEILEEKLMKNGG